MLSASCSSFEPQTSRPLGAPASSFEGSLLQRSSSGINWSWRSTPRVAPRRPRPVHVFHVPNGPGTGQWPKGRRDRGWVEVCSILCSSMFFYVLLIHSHPFLQGGDLGGTSDLRLTYQQFRPITCSRPITGETRTLKSWDLRTDQALPSFWALQDTNLRPAQLNPPTGSDWMQP